MTKRWTEEQASAITSKNQNLLLSAAAGSGKTAVLVARIIARLTDEEHPIPADRLLVVTFTNAAAAEMRERIMASLTALTEQKPDDAFLANQLSLVKKAQITTIDAFCIALLRQNFVAADLSPDFRIADPTESAVLRSEVLEDVLTEMYEDDTFSESFLALLEAYTNAKANDKNFREMLDGLYHFAVSLPDPEGWLTHAADRFGMTVPFCETMWYRAVVDEAKLALEKIVLECETLISLSAADGLDSYVLFFKEQQTAIGAITKKDTYTDIRNALQELSFGRRPALKKDDAAQYRYIDILAKKWDKLKKRCNTVLTDMLSIKEEEQAAAISKMYPLMRCLSEIVIRLNSCFLERKLKRNMLDFNDCEHLCLKLLTNEDGTPSETALEIKKQYEEIYIDEYQDTSRLQEAIFAAIRRENNLFMVGDIKQSIYRFRNTDPSLFQFKRDIYSPEEEAENRKIVLSKNFRSRKSVLSFINYVFERIMSKETGEIDYDETEKLYAGADFPEEAPNPLKTDTELCLIDVSAVKLSAEEGEIQEAEDAEKIELEAIYIAGRIAKLMESGEQVYADGAYRSIRYSDICILSRNIKRSAPVLSAVLSERGIPCYSDKTGGFLDSSEVSLLVSLLSVIDNPYQDLPLLAVLRSILFHFTAGELAKIRAFDYKNSFYEAMLSCAESNSPLGAACRDFLGMLQGFRDKASYMSVSELVMNIYQESGFYDAQQTLSNGELRRANLRLLYERAVAFESTGLKGLYSFTRFLSDYASAGGDFESAKTVGEEQNAVRIMSIHGSKGLEFPVVILYGLGNEFNRGDLKRSVLYHMHMGYGPKFVDTDLRITYPFAPRVACTSILRRENEAEEMRILYVALTRAKEKLILVSAAKDLVAKLNACSDGGKTRKIKASVISSGNSYLDWILAALFNHPDAEKLRALCDFERPICMDESRLVVDIVQDANVLYAERAAAKQAEENAPKSTDIERLISLITYQYPYAQDTMQPPKITVTELKRKMAEQDGESLYLYPKPVRLKKLKRTLSGTEIGTAYHTVLQHCTLAEKLSCPEEAAKEIERLGKAGYLTQEEAEAVSPHKIAAFFASDAGKLLLSAKQVFREVMFGISRPANTLLPEFQSDKEIMLQGVIDCVIETEAGLVVLDYKTDTAPADKIKDTYRVQLACYQMAAEQIYKKPVIQKIIYAFEAGEAIIL